jgi:hypothetical protein
MKVAEGSVEILETNALLEALQEIADKSAIPVIEDICAGDYPAESKRAARRALVLVRESDPVPGLLKLLTAERAEIERSRLILALTKYKSARVVAELARIAAGSDSAFLRREAIDGLARMGGRNALLELAALLEVKFPTHLRAKYGWKEPPEDYSTYFPELVLRALKEATHQDLGVKSRPWADWINQNVKEVER